MGCDSEGADSFDSGSLPFLRPDGTTEFLVDLRSEERSSEGDGVRSGHTESDPGKVMGSIWKEISKYGTTLTDRPERTLDRNYSPPSVSVQTLRLWGPSGQLTHPISGPTVTKHCPGLVETSRSGVRKVDVLPISSLPVSSTEAYWEGRVILRQKDLFLVKNKFFFKEPGLCHQVRILGP